MFSECAELAIFLYVLFAIFWYLRRKRSDLDKKVGGGGGGRIKHESHLSFQDCEGSLWFFFFLERCSNS